MGTGIGEPDERSEGVGDRLLEETKKRMSEGRGEEEDHVEDHQI